MNPVEPPTTSPDAASGEPRAGQMLRAAREAKGIHLAMLSVALKVPTRKLEALERDDHSAFQDVTFLRALAQAVCRHLNMDAAPVLAALPQSVATLPVQRSLIEPRMATPVKSGRTQTAGLLSSKTVLALALLMLVSTAALIWWPARPSEPAMPAVVAEEAAQAYVPMGQASNPVESAAPAVPTAPATPAAPAAPADPAPVATVPELKPGLVLRIGQSAWVEVRDGKGEILVKRQAKARETLQLEADAPVFVYVSQAEGAELVWKGQALDLEPHTRNNEIRLKIKR